MKFIHRKTENEYCSRSYTELERVWYKVHKKIYTDVPVRSAVALHEVKEITT
jgi:hypothetical protein